MSHRVSLTKHVISFMRRFAKPQNIYLEVGNEGNRSKQEAKHERQLIGLNLINVNQI